MVKEINCRRTPSDPPAWAKVKLPLRLRELLADVEREAHPARGGSTPYVKVVLDRCAEVLRALVAGGAS